MMTLETHLLFRCAIQALILYSVRVRIHYALYTVYKIHLSALPSPNCCISAAKDGRDVCALCAANQVLLRCCASPNRNMQLQTSPPLLPVPSSMILPTIVVSCFLFSLQVFKHTNRAPTWTHRRCLEAGCSTLRRIAHIVLSSIFTTPLM